MSFKNFIKAMELAPKCRFFTTVGGKSISEINQAEKILSIKFSIQCRVFYEKYGYLSFFGNEIFGIDIDDDSGILEGNSVLYALNDRKKYALPNEWIPIYNFGDGNLAYLDYSYLNKENEPRVIRAFYDEDKYKIVEILADDFGDFLLGLITNEKNM